MGKYFKEDVNIPLEDQSTARTIESISKELNLIKDIVSLNDTIKKLKKNLADHEQCQGEVCKTFVMSLQHNSIEYDETANKNYANAQKTLDVITTHASELDVEIHENTRSMIKMLKVRLDNLKKSMDAQVGFVNFVVSEFKKDPNKTQ